MRYRDTRPSEAERLKAGSAQANRSAGRSVGVWVWGLVRRVLSAKKKRYNYVTMLVGRETVWDEPACLEGDDTVSMYERFRERQVGLGVCKEEPGWAAIATNGEPAGAGSLSSD